MRVCALAAAAARETGRQLVHPAPAAPPPELAEDAAGYARLREQAEARFQSPAIPPGGHVEDALPMSHVGSVGHSNL